MTRCIRSRTAPSSVFVRSFCASLTIHLMAMGGAMVSLSRPRPLVLGRPASEGGADVVTWRTAARPGIVAHTVFAEEEASPDPELRAAELPPDPEPYLVVLEDWLLIEEQLEPPEAAPSNEPEQLSEAPLAIDEPVLPEEALAADEPGLAGAQATAPVEASHEAEAGSVALPAVAQAALEPQAPLETPRAAEAAGPEAGQVAEAETPGPETDGNLGFGGSGQGEPSDGKPFDLRAPEYPTLSQRLGEEGSVVFSLQVDSDGRILSFEILESSGYPRLDKAAIEAVRTWRRVDRHFLGLKEKESLAGTFKHRVRFKLD